MSIKTFYDSMRRLYQMFKEDTLEVVRQAKKIFGKPNDSKRKEKKHLNVWVGIFITILAVLSFYLILPLIAGMISIIFQETPPEGTPSPSIEALVGFIIIAAALGGLTMWFAGQMPQDDNGSRTTGRAMKFVAKLFLFAALSLSLFMLLSPILPTIKESTGSYEEALKFISLFSFIGGSISFVMALIMGLVYIWKL